MEKKFKFKLDGLLKLREFREQKIKIELGRIITEIQEVEDRIKELREHIVETYEAHEEMASNHAESRYLQFFPTYIEAKRADIKNNENLLSALQRRYEDKRIEMANARGEVKVLEKLKETRSDEHKRKWEKKQSEAIEEIVIQKRAL